MTPFFNLLTMTKQHIHQLALDLTTALSITKEPVKSASLKLSVTSTGEPVVKMLETMVSDKTKFEQILEVLIEFLYKILDLFFKGGEFKKPGFFKYISVAKALIDVIVKIWKIF